jgi:Type I restriction enzyme R protein N terminus (HSDR_N)
MTLTESHVEEATLEWFGSVGYAVAHGPDLGPGEPGEERASYHDVVLLGRLRAALARLNPKAPASALDDAVRAAMRTESPLPHENNRRFHALLTKGVDVEFHNAEGRVVHEKAWLIDFERPENNDWLVVNQYTVVEGAKNRRPDVVVFVNGLPLAVLELKNAADEDATVAARNRFSGALEARNAGSYGEAMRRCRTALDELKTAGFGGKAPQDVAQFLQNKAGTLAPSERLAALHVALQLFLSPAHHANVPEESYSREDAELALAMTAGLLRLAGARASTAEGDIEAAKASDD